jgi:hypothetical protein
MKVLRCPPEEFASAMARLRRAERGGGLNRQLAARRRWLITVVIPSPRMETP